MARTPTTSTDVATPNEDLTEINRRAAEAAAAVTTAQARRRGQTPADTPKSDDAA